MTLVDTYEDELVELIDAIADHRRGVITLAELCAKAGLDDDVRGAGAAAPAPEPAPLCPCGKAMAWHGFTFSWLCPATADHSGWGRPRKGHVHYYPQEDFKAGRAPAS